LKMYHSSAIIVLKLQKMSWGSDKMRHLFIINPVAGKMNNGDSISKAAHEALGPNGDEIIIKKTEYPGHAAEIAKEAAESGVDTIVYACGGDGTLSETASGLVNAENCVLAPVPIGSGNDFVKLFGDNSSESFCDIAALADGEVQEIDVMTVNDKVCLNIASSGFDAEVCAEMPRYRHIPGVSGSMAYNMALVHRFLTSVKCRLGFVIDGENLPKGDYLFAVAANGRFYGGGYKAAPLADFSDGLIDVILVPSLSRPKMLTMISSYRKGEHLDKYPFIEFKRCRSIQYIADKPILMNVDGELFEMTDPTVTILPKALKILVPKKLLEKK